MMKTKFFAICFIVISRTYSIRSIHHCILPEDDYSTSGKSMRTMRTLPCRLIVMRHAERVDDLFPGWIEKSTSTGIYQAYDLNMPLALPELSRPLKHFEDDTVISEMGYVLAQMVGKGLLVNKSVPDAVYVSPALRCVQTAHSALKAMAREEEIKIRIEPALFEIPAIYEKGQPKFATPQELHAANFNIDVDYTPTTTIDNIWKLNESADSYSKRVQDLTRSLARKSEYSERSDGAVIMLVGHASTVDLAIGAFRDPPRTTLAQELINNGAKYPYCCTAIIDRTEDGCWQYNESALPPITYMNFTSKINRDFALRERITI